MSDTLKMFRMSSKDVKMMIPAENRQEAFAKFFIKVKKGEIGLDQLGGIVISHEGKSEDENVPFRVIPTLWLMELIPHGVAFATLEKMLDLDPNTDESANILIQSAREDDWILEEIERLENSEFKENEDNQGMEETAK